MSQTVSGHQQSAFADPQNGQAPIDADQVTANDNALRVVTNAHDADPGLHLQSSVAASKPAAGTAGRKWLSTDTLTIWFDTGAIWSEINYLNKTDGGTVAGATTFSAGITSNVTGNLTGVASSATILATTRAIALGGVLSGSANFDGSAGISITAAHVAGSIVNADISGSAGIVDTKLATISTASKVSNSATTATNANTNSAIVARHTDGSFSAGVITATGLTLTGLLTTVASATGTAGIRLPHGVAPSSPVNGDVWTTTAGIFVRVNGTSIGPLGSAVSAEPSDGDKGDITVSGSGLTWAIDALAIGNAHINTSAAIAYSKLNLTGAVLNADLAGSIAYSKLVLTGAVLNADLAGSIADTKLSTISTAGKVSNSATTATNLNTASAIVARDASGNFTAGTITATTFAGGTHTGTTYAGSDADMTTSYKVAGSKVVGARETGWGPTWIIAANATADASDNTAPGSLATACSQGFANANQAILRAMYNAMVTHGLIGA